MNGTGDPRQSLSHKLVGKRFLKCFPYHPLPMRINSTDFSRFRFRVDKKLVENVSDERGTYIYKAINDPSKNPPWPIAINPDHIEDVAVYVHEFTELCLTVLIFNILYREMDGESIIVPPYIPSHDIVLLSLGYSERDMFENEDTRTLD